MYYTLYTVFVCVLDIIQKTFFDIYRVPLEQMLQQSYLMILVGSQTFVVFCVSTRRISITQQH